MIFVLKLKVHGPISWNGILYSKVASSPKKFWFFKIAVKSVKAFRYREEITIAIAYLTV